MAYSGDVTADLEAILREHCPDIADEVVAAYRVARAFAGVPDDAGGQPGTGDPSALRWSKLTLGEIPGVQQFVDITSGPLQAVTATLRVIAGLLDALAIFLLEIPDPIRAMILAAYQILKELVDDLLASGAYVYSDVPGLTSWKATLADLGEAAADPASWKAGDPVVPPPTVGAFDGWANTFQRSFDDPGDQHRPVFSEGATVEAVFLLATAPGMAELRPLLTLLALLTDGQQIKQAADAIGQAHKTLPGFDEWLRPDPDDERLRGKPTGPNWRSWKLRDVAPPDYPLRELERVPELLRALLLNVDGIVGLLKDLINALRSKIDLLLEITEMIQRVIEMIEALTASGLHVLAVVTHDGVQGLVDAFRSAEDRPGVDADGNEVPGLVIGGACVLAGTSTTLALGQALIWELLGVDGAMDQARAALADDVARHRAAFAAAGQAAEDAYDRMKDSAREADEDYVATIRAEARELAIAASELGPALGALPEAIEQGVRGARAELMGQVEQLGVQGMPLDPVVLAAMHATRAARRRGRRSLVMRHGDDQP